MKKFICYILLILSFFVIFFLQVNVFSNLTIGGIKPNLFIIFIIFVSLFSNSVCGISIGIIVGLILDLLYASKIGINGAVYGLIAFLGSYFDKNFSKDNKLTILFIIAILTFIYEFFAYFINSIVMEFEIEYFYFMKKIIVEIIYNVLISIIIYPLFKNVGYNMERIFKKNNVLTRYF